MKVVVIGYNPPTGPFSYGSVSVWAAHGWEELGHEVEMYDRSQMDQLPKKADIYFFVDVSEDYSASMPKDLDGLKVFWNMDMQMPGGTERAVNIARNVDYTFCTNYEYGVKLLDRFGIESTWVPYGYDHELQREVNDFWLKDNRVPEYLDDLPTENQYEIKRKIQTDYKYDVCMIGNLNSPERKQLWELLTQKYGERALVGTVDSREEYVKAKAGSRIMVSQPTEPFNTIINLRVWNATACGKLLLCKRPGVKEHEILGFVDGKNVVYWDTFEDLLQKIDYYLTHPEEANKIAAEGSKLGNKHLMPNQIRVIEQVLFSKFYERLV